MKRIILCEGRTDAILINYFLKGRFGWTYIEPQKLKTLKLPKLPVEQDNEVFNWYNHSGKPNHELAIWGVGGIDQMSVKLRHVIDRNRIERTINNRFEHIVLFFDHDDMNETECKTLIENWMTNSNLEILGDLQLGQWRNARIKLSKSLRENYELNILPIVLPPDSPGNLETFLIDSIRDQYDHDKHLVVNAERFIECIPNKPYLNKSRYRPKACLGSILSVMSPDWVFSKLDDRLSRVQWEKIESVMSVYRKLGEL